jgi:hypothetical protein
MPSIATLDSYLEAQRPDTALVPANPFHVYDLNNYHLFCTSTALSREMAHMARA